MQAALEGTKGPSGRAAASPRRAHSQASAAAWTARNFPYGRNTMTTSCASMRKVGAAGWGPSPAYAELVMQASGARLMPVGAGSTPLLPLPAAQPIGWQRTFLPPSMSWQ